MRRELEERSEHLPRWISALSRVDVYRAVRRTNVFGDVDELVIGTRLEGGHELTIAVHIDHNTLSSIVDAGAVPDPIDEALERVADSSSDTDVFEMTHCDGAQRASNTRSAARPTSTSAFRWKWCWTPPICCARSSQSRTPRAGYETN